jgi:putative ABC transport system substrate-binding protein
MYKCDSVRLYSCGRRRATGLHAAGFDYPANSAGKHTPSDRMITRRIWNLVVATAFVVAAGAMVAWSTSSLAQTTSKRLPRIGVLWHAGNAAEEKIPLTSLVEGLSAAGLIDGQTMTIAHRFPNEEPERFRSLAVELVALKPDVLVVVTRQAALAARQATSTIPIFFLSVPDPVESGLVTSLARPGGNITGFSSMAVELIPKRIDLLIGAVPGITSIALVINGNFETGVRVHQKAGDAAAARLGIKVEPFLIRAPADFKPVFADIKRSGARGIVVAQDGLFYANMTPLAELARQHGLPMMVYAKEMAEAGAVISYGADIPAYFRRAGASIARILKGTKPADIPIEQPIKFALVVNLKTAKAIGLTIPQSILVQADEVIQ